MRSNLVRKVVFVSVLITSQLSFAQAPAYSPQALREIVHTAQMLKSNGRQPLVMFDLDDTLINTKERNLRILKDFAKQSSIRNQFQVEVARVDKLSLNQIRYLMTDTLREIGIIDSNFIKAVGDFWLPRFFSNEYCARDLATPGAARYLHELSDAGALIIYLTGRDIPRMREGTIANLKANGFPLNPYNAFLIMKPDPKMDDLEFKKKSFTEIGAMGEMVGVFENEPANINAMADAFPSAVPVFVDTIHSPKPDVPESRVKWVRDFHTED